MTLIAATLLTLSAALWRFLDGRGWGGRTTYRNLAGLAIALGCAYVGMGLTWQAAGCALLAWGTLILGFTDWPNWRVSFPRYVVPATVTAGFAEWGGADPIRCGLYFAASFGVAGLYVVLHRTRDFRWNTAVCETVAGAVIVGGLAWL